MSQTCDAPDVLRLTVAPFCYTCLQSSTDEAGCPQQRHLVLLEKNRTGSMTPEERQELADLRVEADRLMVRKAYAWAILRWRGHRGPPVEELPLE